MKYVSEMNPLPLAPLIAAVETDAKGLVAKAEAAYQAEIDQVAQGVVANGQKVILLCGPSSAGKTTSAKKIINALKKDGHKVNRVSLDDFYKNPEDLPRWQDGNVNYESIEGLDIDLFHRQMVTLFKTGEAEFPVFYFKNPKERGSFRLFYDDDTYTIVEGIHALNPKLLASLNGLPCCRVYVSVHSDFLADDGSVRLAGRTLRLARRMIRDVSHRDASPETTFGMWEYILRGERLYIHPYRKDADFHIDTSHAYEPFVYAKRLRSLLCQTQDCNTGLHELGELLLSSFAGLPGMAEELVPASSLLQEFIG